MCVQYTFSLTEHTEFYYLFPTGLHRLHRLPPAFCIEPMSIYNAKLEKKLEY